MKKGKRASSDDVLEAFALEGETGKTTLEKYLRNYPEYSEALVEFANEIAKGDVVRRGPLSSRENALIDAAWEKHVGAASKPVTDPITVLSVAQLRRVAETLDVPRQILTAFRDRTVLVGSVPKRFLEQLASAIDSKIDALTAYLEAPGALSLARSHKADSKPKVGQRVTFEQLLVDAGVSPGKRKKLMAEG